MRNLFQLTAAETEALRRAEAGEKTLPKHANALSNARKKLRAQAQAEREQPLAGRSKTMLGAARSAQRARFFN